MHHAWQGEHGGKHPETAYRRFVEAGLDTPPENPLLTATAGWLLGSSAFVERIKGLMKTPKYEDEVPLARQLSSVPLEDVLQVVADHYGVDPASFAVKHSKESSRDVAAWLARRVTTATLRELSSPLGLGHPDSVRNLIRRAEQAMQQSGTFRKEVDRVLRSLEKNENRV